MEEDLENLEKALSNLETSQTSESKPNDHEDLYKNWGKLGNQEERRKELLFVQKSNRNNKIDRFRGILELVTAVEESDLFKGQRKTTYRPNIYVAGFNKTSLTYSNVLMLSEWMIEKPQDFEENWFVVPCPKALRVLIVSNNGCTKFYTKYGHFKFECRTALPGGNPCGYKSNCCVLDGFYYEAKNTVYILDLLAWNNQPMTDGETEFRHYWLMSQFDELPDLKVINKKNTLIFEILLMTPCTSNALSELFNKYPMFDNYTPSLDGLLLYHKKAHYVAGQTPLVGWLYPYMIPEILSSDIKINPEYMAERPENYVNQAQFIQSFELKYQKRKRRTGSNNTTMEIETSKTEAESTNEEDKTITSDVMEAEEEAKTDDASISQQDQQSAALVVEGI